MFDIIIIIDGMYSSATFLRIKNDLYRRVFNVLYYLVFRWRLRSLDGLGLKCRNILRIDMYEDIEILCLYVRDTCNTEYLSVASRRPRLCLPYNSQDCLDT